MPITVARLRLWIVALAVLLVAALAAFIGYARYKAARVIGDLPGKLGVQIARSSNGFTYSQSVKGRTAFTIHASNAVQYKGGANATLHDVVITLYGAQGDRSDRISGSEFDYDQKAGIVTARGEVRIDLQGADLASSPIAAAKDAAAAAASLGMPAKAAGQVIHVKTSGLVFNQGSQIATTSQPLEFSTPKGSGHATGATYDVRKELLVLDSAVELTSSRDGEPVVVRASHAEFLRSSMQAFLLKPVVNYRSEATTADQATVYFRKDGSAEHIDALGNIHLKTPDGQEMTSRAAKVLLDEKSGPKRADLSGGVDFTGATAAQAGANLSQQMHGNAVEATLTFAPGGVIGHAQARNAVSFVDRQSGLSGDPGGSATRELRASQVDVDFAQDAAGHAQPGKVLAAGGATAVLHTIRTKGASQNTTIKGDQLLATLRDGRTITGLHGTGHTSVLDLSPDEASNLSTGDTLQVNFLSPAGRAAAQTPAPGGSSFDAARIQSVVQEGNVTILQTPTVDSAHPAAPTRATARRADYDAATQSLRLTGSPRIENEGAEIAADSIDYRRGTRSASATGNVKATYRQTAATAQPGAASVPASVPGIGGEGPTHVIAASADFDQARGVAVFRGNARLWQGANSVSAPILELTRNPDRLKAYSEPAAANAVLTVLTAASGPQPGVFRVRSRQLLYSDADRRAIFTGAVTADDASGVLHSDQVEAFLVPVSGKPEPKAQNAPSAGSSRIDRVVATGHVVLQQPGRRGTGEKLLYTAQDGKFVLTGTFAEPPHLYDSVHGNVSGDALTLNSRDDSVIVTGGGSRAVTNTRTAK
jgi:lipopolysaccharide export system protein LptA